MIGGWDPSARKFFKTDELSFTVPFQMFRDMLKRHGESFLTTKDWETVQKKITRSKKTWGETLSVKRDGVNAMSNVILINPFEVPEGREDECLAFWEKAADFMRCQPGFISTRLHKAVSPEAKFRFINMAEWESTEHFQTAIESETFKELTAP